MVTSAEEKKTIFFFPRKLKIPNNHQGQRVTQPKLMITLFSLQLVKTNDPFGNKVLNLQV